MREQKIRREALVVVVKSPIERPVQLASIPEGPLSELAFSGPNEYARAINGSGS
jgi:hypothetical protein